MFFEVKREEVGAVSQFRKTCVTHGLDIKLSLKALNALKHAVEAHTLGDVPDIGDRDLHTLGRRGLVRVTSDGEPIITQLGLLVAALAEAGNLITLKGAVAAKGRIKSPIKPPAKSASKEKVNEPA